MTNTNGLKVKKLELGGHLVIVSEATYMMGIQRGLLLSEFLEKPREPQIVQNVLLNVYVGLAACSSGDVPSPDEFLDLRETEAEAWIAAARELNPEWFSYLDLAEQAATESVKKKRRRTKNLSSPPEVGPG